jgi:regulator of protease activity HflC (stomatin/prohibitin superfamily)
MAIVPKYRVWSRELNGKALLREAEYSKRVLIEQAKAELESSTMYAGAEIERAKGVAESMQIISEELEKNKNYLHYLAIQAQEKMANSPNHTTIYIPVGSNGIPLIKDLAK